MMNIQQFQRIAQALLQKHYGLDLGDTLLTEDNIVADCIRQGYRPHEVINEHAQKADLDRIDLPGDYGVYRKDPLTAQDEVT
jgi:hypothetical protein